MTGSKLMMVYDRTCTFFFFNDTATTEIYTLSLHDALPICAMDACRRSCGSPPISATTATTARWRAPTGFSPADRKSTRLNSSHSQISYAVFCLKKKKKKSHHLRHDSEWHTRLHYDIAYPPT